MKKIVSSWTTFYQLLHKLKCQSDFDLLSFLLWIIENKNTKVLPSHQGDIIYSTSSNEDDVGNFGDARAFLFARKTPKKRASHSEEASEKQKYKATFQHFTSPSSSIDSKERRVRTAVWTFRNNTNWRTERNGKKRGAGTKQSLYSGQFATFAIDEQHWRKSKQQEQNRVCIICTFRNTTPIDEETTWISIHSKMW